MTISTAVSFGDDLVVDDLAAPPPPPRVLLSGVKWAKDVAKSTIIESAVEIFTCERRGIHAQSTSKTTAQPSVLRDYPTKSSHKYTRAAHIAAHRQQEHSGVSSREAFDLGLSLCCTGIDLAVDPLATQGHSVRAWPEILTWQAW
ncbi:hypothetical protein RRG08_024192 [Elysia crispata]|uniref:Uncharacterized protein n=1 Tax=Elysia crispata TaxID=231223 RepID=A0AAE0YQC6_9GAST|nr:hypothetical protein RRG08_024192 [Elysia crispata]